ncbi:class IV lanthionine synthetase LanL [Streptomyces sp. NPDC015492]|uniref:class IV lanthionine synthetase LanL n=1 Tax=Streptomyces sp. NPDC015492 TaxID=3364958 RepID=UPI0036FE8B78
MTQRTNMHSHTAARREPLADSRLLTDLAEAALARHGRDWTLRHDDFWCRVVPPEHSSADQGWKIHLSATPLSAPLVLARSAEILLPAGCFFKFARDLGRAATLVDRNQPRGYGGKFLTAYPQDVEACRALARRLHDATADLHGPRVLSDRPYAPGSLVHFRYGVFSAKPTLTHDGSFEFLLRAPDGTPHKDERRAWFSPPSWATPPPFDASPPRPTEDAATAVLVAGRFRVSKAIKHANRGGVYRALDQLTGAEVVLKHARPHVDARLDGTDARDVLRHEAEILDVLAPLGVAPRAVALVEQQGSLFLAQEHIPGVTLRRWATDHVHASGAGRGVPLPEVSALAPKIASLLDKAHGVPGLVLRDLTPQNIMVTPDGSVVLVDLEGAATEGEPARRMYTPAYGAPEQSTAPLYAPAPARSVDAYALGMVLFFLATGRDPLIAGSSPENEADQTRRAALIEAIQESQPGLRTLAPAIKGLTADEPADRWQVSHALAYLQRLSSDDAPPSDESRHGRLDAGTTPTVTRREHGSRAGRTAENRVEGLVAGGLQHLLNTIRPDEDRLWPSGQFGSTTDPCNVQHGAAGVLGVLVQAARSADGAMYRDAVRRVAEWTVRRSREVPSSLPGLYFGRSGTAWALHDAARFLEDEELAACAVEMLEAVALDWPNPDVCHGLSGAGMAFLHVSGESDARSLTDSALTCADRVLEARRRENGRVVWPIPREFRSDLAGVVHYGFAHGVAGAGAFLLAAAQVSGRQAYLDAAVEAGQTLCAVAEASGGAARWPTGPSPRQDGRPEMQHWCSGASGVGTFLVRLWQVTGDDHLLTLSRQAAETVHRARWNSGNAACHGLAGDGDFLLDMAELTDDARYGRMARDMADVMYALRSERDGLGLVTDESGHTVTADYGTGLAGALGFLLRLEAGGPRPWMPSPHRVGRPSSARAGSPLPSPPLSGSS